jgi:hypothetical protein
MLQAALADFPFPFGALRFAAVELTKGVTLRNLVDKLPLDPIPDSPRKAHGATAPAFRFIRTATKLSIKGPPKVIILKI